MNSFRKLIQLIKEKKSLILITRKILNYLRCLCCQRLSFIYSFILNVKVFLRSLYFSKLKKTILGQEWEDSILDFIETLRVVDIYRYKYSTSCTQPTLYASAYVCMTFSLLGKLKDLSQEERRSWIDYFDSFQSEEDGLFYDPVLDSDFYRNTDWWGARHLALHMISAYTDLSAKPQYPFIFLRNYYEPEYLKSWLDSFDWHSAMGMTDDIDNKIMNIGCLLQYQRDTWNDSKAGEAIFFLQDYLLKHINPKTGMWGYYNVKNHAQLSRMVQFAYHLFPLFFYDQIPVKYPEKIIKYVLATQNRVGGFGIQLNSSACEDIDSIDLLCRLSHFVDHRTKKQIDSSLKRALDWVLCNQLKDGGFVFRLYEPFTYGHKETSSLKSQGAMLPTWFRVLCSIYLMKYLKIPNKFILTKCPSYEF